VGGHGDGSSAGGTGRVERVRATAKAKVVVHAAGRECATEARYIVDVGSSLIKNLTPLISGLSKVGGHARAIFGCWVVACRLQGFVGGGKEEAVAGVGLGGLTGREVKQTVIEEAR